jgi:hypothetical protein
MRQPPVLDNDTLQFQIIYWIARDLLMILDAVCRQLYSAIEILVSNKLSNLRPQNNMLLCVKKGSAISAPAHTG